MSHDHSMTILQERTLHFTRDAGVLVYPAYYVSSLAPYLHEETDTIMLAHAAEAAKRAYKKISSHTVDTDVGVLANTCGATAGIE